VVSRTRTYGRRLRGRLAGLAGLAVFSDFVVGGDALIGVVLANGGGLVGKVLGNHQPAPLSSVTLSGVGMRSPRLLRCSRQASHSAVPSAIQTRDGR
jgi:hypothetical protein